MQLKIPEKFTKRPEEGGPFGALSTGWDRVSTKHQRGVQNGMALCRPLVVESLVLLVGESTQFTGKNSRAYPSTTMKDRA